MRRKELHKAGGKQLPEEKSLVPTHMGTELYGFFWTKEAGGFFKKYNSCCPVHTGGVLIHLVVAKATGTSTF